MLYLFFSKSSKLSQLYHHRDSSKSLQGFTLCFQLLFPFVWSFFYYRSSSWRLYMMVHQGFNSFSKCSSRLFSEELKYSSSCSPKCNSFYLIIWGGVMSFLTIWVRVSCFTCCQEWDILNPPISSLDLSCVMFHLKPSLRNVAIMVLINDPSFLLSSWWKKFFIALVLSLKSMASFSGRLSPHNVEMFP